MRSMINRLTQVLKQLTAGALLMFAVTACAPFVPTTEPSAIPAPTRNALEQKEMSIKYQREILDLVPPEVIDPRTSEMPEIGSLEKTLVRCEFDTPYPTAAPVYYNGGFVLILKDSVDLHEFFRELNERIEAQPERQRWTHDTTTPPDRSEWYFGDEYIVSMSVYTRGKDGAKIFSVSVASPCFFPEPPHSHGDKI